MTVLSSPLPTLCPLPHPIPFHPSIGLLCPAVTVPFIVVVKFEGDKLKAERIYWDQVGPKGMYSHTCQRHSQPHGAVALVLCAGIASHILS